jgi:hypothetical protein
MGWCYCSVLDGEMPSRERQELQEQARRRLRAYARRRRLAERKLAYCDLMCRRMTFELARSRVSTCRPMLRHRLPRRTHRRQPRESRGPPDADSEPEPERGLAARGAA